MRGPDLAVVRRERIGSLHSAGFLRGAPDLAVEVVSPSNKAGEVQAKVAEYLAAGAQIVWVIYPMTRTVAVHESQGQARFLRDDDVLTGGALLPDFRVPVAELFRD